MNETIINTQEAAELLQVTPIAVRKLLERGRIEGRKLARDWAINRESVLAYKAWKEARPDYRSESK